jgi:two-component system response regulator NreC
MAKRLVEDYLQRISSGEERASHALLSPRERQILALIGAGHTNQEIADQLALSVNTVQAHRSHIIDKLDLHSRADLMRYAVRVGLQHDPG